MQGILGGLILCLPLVELFAQQQTPAEIPFPEIEPSEPFEFPYRAEFLSPAWDSAVAEWAKEMALAAAQAKRDSLVQDSLHQASLDSLRSVETAQSPAILRRPIRVLLHSESESVTLHLQGSFTLTSVQAEQSIPQGITLQGRISLKPIAQRWEITREGGAKTVVHGDGIRLAPQTPTAYFQWNGNPYRGQVEAHVNPPHRAFLLLNTLPMETYLQGVLPYELGRVDIHAFDALKALAVVARTYAMKRMVRPGGARFDVHDDVQDQVYKGFKDAYALSDRALEETRGQVLVHQDTLILGFYHSTCGGKTAARHEVWGGSPIPYLMTRDDINEQGQAFCAPSPLMTWTQTWSRAELISTLKKNFASGRTEGPSHFRTLTGFTVENRARCGRILSLRIDTDAGPLRVKGDKTRWLLKPRRTDGRILESANFDISLEDDLVTAKGQGFGHGVGLCQWGAIQRAKAGQNYQRILTAYYAGTRIIAYRSAGGG